MVYLGKNFDPNYKRPEGRQFRAQPPSAGAPGNFQQNTTFPGYPRYAPFRPAQNANPDQFQPQGQYRFYNQFQPNFYQPYYQQYPFQQNFVVKSYFTQNEPFLAASDDENLAAFATIDNQIHIFEAKPLNDRFHREATRVQLYRVKLIYLTSDRAPMHIFSIKFVKSDSVVQTVLFLTICTTVGVIFVEIQKKGGQFGVEGSVGGASQYAVRSYDLYQTGDFCTLTKFIFMTQVSLDQEYSFRYLAVEGDVYFDQDGHQQYGSNFLREYAVSFDKNDKSVNEFRYLDYLELRGRVCCLDAGGMVLQEQENGFIVNKLLLFDQNFHVVRVHYLDDICYDCMCCFEQFICLTSFQGFGCLVHKQTGEIKYFVRMGQLIYKENLIRIPRVAEVIDSITQMTREGENSILMATSRGVLLKLVFQFGEVMLVQDILQSQINDPTSRAFRGSEMTCFCQLKDCVCCGFGSANNESEGEGENSQQYQGRNGIIARVRHDNMEGENVCEVIRV